MLVRSVASGVRSSCEASATRRRWADSERSSAASISLKLAARRPSSSSPRTSIRWVRSWVRATSSAASETSPAGASAVRATTGPEGSGERDSPRAHGGEDDDQRVEGVVRLLERVGDLDSATGGQRLGEHAQIRPLNGDVAELRIPAARGELAVGARDRQRVLRVGIGDDCAVRSDHLGERGRRAGCRRRHGLLQEDAVTLLRTVALLARRLGRGGRWPTRADGRRSLPDPRDPRRDLRRPLGDDVRLVLEIVVDVATEMVADQHIHEG